MQYTTNYNWKMPDQTDNYNIQNENDNWSSLDSTLKSISNSVTTAQNTANAAIPSTQKGAANGVAGLDANSLLLSTNMPKATSSALGAIKVGTGLNTAGDGTLSATPASVGAIASNLLGAVNGVASLDANTRLPVAQLPSAIPAANLPTATAAALGLVKVGSNLSIAGDGTISGPAPYSLPVATATVLGGVKVGTGIAVGGDGTISTTPVNAASSNSLGIVELPQTAGTPATPIAVYRAARVQENLMADTTLDNILTFTPAAQGSFLVAVSVRLTATTNVTINITWTDASGNLQTDQRINNQSLAAGTHDVPVKYINATTASAITVQVQAGTANQVYATASIVGV